MRRSPPGLSLMEVMLAVGLAALTLLLLTGVIMGGTRLMARASSVATATEVGRQFLETARRNGYDKIPETSKFFDGRVPDPQAGEFPPPPYPVAEVAGTRYPITVRVAPATGTNRALTVEVYYADRSKITLYTVVHP